MDDELREVHDAEKTAALKLLENWFALKSGPMKCPVCGHGRFGYLGREAAELIIGGKFAKEFRPYLVFVCDNCSYRLTFDVELLERAKDLPGGG